MYSINEEDFESFCRDAYDRMKVVLEILGIINDDTFEDFKERNYHNLEVQYLTSIDKLSIH